jgi:uncharacterized protein GlcG (DUF336 family)
VLDCTSALDEPSGTPADVGSDDNANRPRLGQRRTTMTIHTRPYLTEAQARDVLDTAADEARAMGWPVTIAIVDGGGHLLALQRLEGASPASSDIAVGKARTAALGRRDSKFYEDMLASRPAFLTAPGLGCLLEGGLAIVLAGACVGGIGVSGVKSNEDAQVALAGLKALPNS